MHQLLSSIAFLCLLALPLAAQEEALHGTWEGTFADDEIVEGTVRLTFQADGSFDFNLFIEELIYPGDEVEVPDELLDELTEIIEVFSALEGISAHGGTYQVSDDSLWVHNDNVVEYIVGGESVAVVEFWTPIIRLSARFLAAFVAVFEEVSEEDYPAFEQAIIDEFLAEFLAGLDEEPLGLGLTLSGIYAIEDDTLFITTTTDVDGVETVETVEFQRIDVASAVVQTSWGDLKAAWRP